MKFQIETDWIIETDYKVNGGKEGILELLKRKRRRTAIFSGNNSVAIRVIKELENHGYQVPEDKSIVTFDD